MNKVCISCEKEKDNKSYRQNQKVCIECESDPTSEKVCNTCDESKPLSKFRAGRAKCIACAEPTVGNTVKVCLGCDEEKKGNLFRRGQRICKECEGAGTVEYDKICVSCNKTKPSSLFRTNRKHCIDCERADGRNYRKTTDTGKIWVENNREKMKELQHDHYVNNKVEIRQKQSDRYHTDPHVKMIKLYRSSIQHLIKTGKNNKKLGMNRDQYIAWLDFYFTDIDMCIENYGIMWNVDHSLPLDMLKTRMIGSKIIPDEYDLDCLFLWFNTVPVLCEDNLKKNKYYVSDEHLALHLRNLQIFIKHHGKKLDIPLLDSFYEYKKIIQYIIDN
jgi:hypothetical protein